MPFYQATKNQRSGPGGGFLQALNQKESDQPKGFYSAVNGARKDKADLESVDGLIKLARQKGLLPEAEEAAQEDSLSFLQRLSSGLGALNPAEAIARDYEGTENFLIAYPKTVVQGIASALTGNDYGEQTKKRYFGELLKDMGVENKYAQFGIGLVGDILLDPSTYVGGSLVRFGVKGTAAVAKTGLKGLAKVSPKGAEGLILAGKALKDAGGELFVHGYGASKGLATDMLEFEGKKMNVQKTLAISNAKRYGNDVLTDGQWEEFLGYIFRGKSAEFNYFDEVSDEMLDAFNKKFPNAKFPMLKMDITAEDFALSKGVEIIKFNDLPDYAKGGIQSELREKITNEGASSDLIKNLGNTRYIKIEKKVSELLQDNPAVTGKNFTERQIMSEGPIVLNKSGEVIDGNNRLRQAWKQGDETIKVFEPMDEVDFKQFQIDYNEAKKAGTLEDIGIKTMRTELSKKLGREASDIEVRSAIRTQAIGKIEQVVMKVPEKIGKLQVLRDQLAKPFIEGDLMGLKSTISELRKELSDLIPKTIKKVPKSKPFIATGEEIDGALMSALSSKKDEYTKIILDLEARIAGIESGLIAPAMKQVTKQVADKSARFNIEEILQQVMRKLDPKLRIKDTIVQVTKQITQLTNDMFMKQHLLEGVLAGKQVAKERIAKAFTSGDFSSLPEELVNALRPVIDDPTIEKTLTERLAHNAKISAAAGIEDPFHMYAPSIAKDITERQRILNFFSGTKGVRVGSKDYTKEFRNLLKDEELLKDRSLFLRIEDEIATNELTEEFLKKTVDDYGKVLNVFKSEREAAVAGYKVLKSKGVFGKEMGYVLDADWKFLNSHMNNNYKAFDAIAKATGFDAATSLFKRFITGLFAPFHVRNFASGEIQNFELIGRVAQAPKVQAAGLRLGHKISTGAFSELADPFDAVPILGKKLKTFGDETIELHGKAWKIDDIGQAIERRFGGSSRYNVDYNSITEDAEKLLDPHIWSKESLKDWGKKFMTFNPVKGAWNLVSENNPLFQQARVIGAWVEMQQKSKLVIGALEKGLGMDEALDIAAKGGFDYRAFTQFESKIMRRIIPFYSFNRKNLELQLHVLKTNPQRINQVIRSVENVQNLWETNLTSEEKDNLPAYLKEYLSVPVGRTNQGTIQFVSDFGTPIEAFTKLVKFDAEGKSSIERTFLSTLSQVNPYIKVLTEIGIGKDSFRQRDIKDVYTAPEYEIAPQILKDYLRFKKVVTKDFKTGLPRITYVADPERLHVVRSLFTSRGFTYFTNVFNENITGFFRIMDALSGIRTREIDVERQAGFTDRRRREELGNLLRRNGILSEFNKLFIPVNK
mgnify:CR=1 FL=1